MSCASVTVECTQCPVRPATNSADIPRSTCYVTSAMDVILAHYNCTLSRSLGDGHCLLYSVLSSCLCQLPDNIHITTLECIKSYIFIELSDNIQYYLPFFQTADNQCIFKGLNDYLIHKIYNQEFGDLVPALIANALNTRLVIFNEDRVKSSVDVINITPRGHTTKYIMLHICGEHYNGIQRPPPAPPTTPPPA